MTTAREAILRAIERHAEPFSPEELVPEVGVGRATVYRTLRLLADQGFICRITDREGLEHRYHVSAAAHDQHAICGSCGTVDEIESAQVDEVMRTLLGRLGFSLVTLRLEAHGICHRCVGTAAGEAV